jgi:hypothetical protein
MVDKILAALVLSMVGLMWATLFFGVISAGERALRANGEAIREIGERILSEDRDYRQKVGMLKSYNETCEKLEEVRRVGRIPEQCAAVDWEYGWFYAMPGRSVKVWIAAPWEV